MSKSNELTSRIAALESRIDRLEAMLSTKRRTAVALMALVTTAFLALGAAQTGAFAQLAPNDSFVRAHHGQFDTLNVKDQIILGTYEDDESLVGESFLILKRTDDKGFALDFNRPNGDNPRTPLSIRTSGPVTEVLFRGQATPPGEQPYVKLDYPSGQTGEIRFFTP